MMAYLAEMFAFVSMALSIGIYLGYCVGYLQGHRDGVHYKRKG